jgi:UDP-GlcNAc:undecaprenyl-phosphate GlcNAc-1-phosphate transferase
LVLLFGGIVLSIFCFVDDLKDIPSYVKLIGQILAAIIVTYSGVRIEKIFGIINSPFLSYLITVIWIVGITNAINLIDGLDGLSSGICIISCTSLLIIFSLNGSPLISIILITALAGALLGFIPFNFNPAKTFIGDTGSNFLGYALSIIAILGVAKTYTAIVLIAPLIIFALPLLDTGAAIVRRVIKTKSFKGIFQADKEHFHHKILKKGYNQKQAVFILYGISTAFGMFAIILLESRNI